jgi:hypothetical protein
MNLLLIIIISLFYQKTAASNLLLQYNLYIKKYYPIVSYQRFSYLPFLNNYRYNNLLNQKNSSFSGLKKETSSMQTFSEQLSPKKLLLNTLHDNVLSTLGDYAISKEIPETYSKKNAVKNTLLAGGASLLVGGARFAIKAKNPFVKAVCVAGAGMGAATLGVRHVYDNAHGVAKNGINFLKNTYGDNEILYGKHIADKMYRNKEIKPIGDNAKLICTEKIAKLINRARGIDINKNFFDEISKNVILETIALKGFNKQFDQLSLDEKIQARVIYDLAKENILKNYTLKIADNLAKSGRADSILKNALVLGFKGIPQLFNNEKFIPNEKNLDNILLALKNSSLEVLKHDWQTLTTKAVWRLIQYSANDNIEKIKNILKHNSLISRSTSKDLYDLYLKKNSTKFCYIN